MAQARIVPVGLRLTEELVERLDDYARRHPYPRPTKQAIVQQALRQWLDANSGLLFKEDQGDISQP